MTQSASVRDIYRSYAQRFDDPAMKLGWESAQAQRRNFDAVLSLLTEEGYTPLAGSTLHDAGCGMGHLLSYLNEREDRPATYIGTDASVEFLAEARNQHPGADFRRLNLLSAPAPTADITVCVGMLAFHNPRSIRQLLNTLWKATARVLAFNCWWHMDGYWSEYEPDDIRDAVNSFCADVAAQDFALCSYKDGGEYGVPTERLFMLMR